MPRSLRATALVIALMVGTTGCGADRHVTSDRTGVPIHLEDRLESAVIAGGDPRALEMEPRSWSFAQDAAGWRALPSLVAESAPAEVDRTSQGLRLRLTESNLAPDLPGEKLAGGVYVEVPEWEVSEWSAVTIEARVEGPVTSIGVGYNLREEAGEEPNEQWPTLFWGAGTRPTTDGESHTYRIRAYGEGKPVAEPVRQIAIEIAASGPAEVELRSVTLEPFSADYAEGVGVRSVSSMQHESFGPQRRALYAIAPSRVSFPLEVPTAGRLDLALGSIGGEVRMAIEVADGDSSEILLEETVTPRAAWRQSSLDLSKWSGRDVTLTLASEASSPAVAYWASPTVSTANPQLTGRARRPNVVFYVIDGASAGQMSVYGYPRPTTPNLERIAAEGVVFENAHSNATWTMPSTASFMTSLHHSVLGGLRRDANPVPQNVRTMAEHFHAAGFHTGVFTFNPNAGGLSGLERGVDVFRDYGKRGEPLDPIEAISSQVLQGQFWEWRDAYPGPYWVHFQTTDVHPPYHPPEPFAGRVAPAGRGEELAKQLLGMRWPFGHDSASVHEHWQEELERKGLDAGTFYGALRDVHDEAMMHQDHQLGRLVEELKERGEWQNTLLIVASDHGHPAATYPRFGRGLVDPQPPAWEGALFGEFESHVPLIFVWPGGFEGGRRIDEPVSMIDVLPTILELADLPPPPIAQGQSLAPLLRGEEGFEPRPVIFDEFRLTEDGTLIGNLEMLDRRLGRSLEIRTAEAEPAPNGRHPAPAGGRWKALSFDDVPRLLIYDVESDPRAIRHVEEPTADVVADAERQLWELWRQHRELSEQIEVGTGSELSAQQLEALRALGYVQ